MEREHACTPYGCLYLICTSILTCKHTPARSCIGNVCIDNHLTHSHTHTQRCEGCERLVDLFIYSPAALIQVRLSPAAQHTHTWFFFENISKRFSLWVCWRGLTAKQVAHTRRVNSLVGVQYATAAEEGYLGEALISSDSCLVRVEALCLSPMWSTVCLPLLFDVFIASLPEELTN